MAFSLFLCAHLGTGSAAAAMPFGAQYEDQSAFALGSVTLSVVFVESDGSIDANQEDWTADQLSQLEDEILTATRFWSSQTDAYHPNARLSFNVDFVNGGVPVATGYEPITRRGNGGGAHVWITDVMDELGYAGSHFSSTRYFNHQQRISAGTHWATTMFVVNDLVDEDNRFSDEAFAYGWLGGPYLVTTYDNGRWGVDNFDRILAHELGHTFFALDEYEESGVRNTAGSGYLNGVNGNAQRDGSGRVIDPPQPSALMLDATLSPSPWTSVQVGHLDSDADGIPDILDTFPTLTGMDGQSDSTTGTFHFAGQTQVNTIPNDNRGALSNSRSAMTINWIDSARYNLDGAGWTEFDPLDGNFGDYLEPLAFTLQSLAAGEHTIDVLSYNSVGNPSAMLRFAFTSTVPEPSTLLLAVAAFLLTAVTRCRPLDAAHAHRFGRR